MDYRKLVQELVDGMPKGYSHRDRLLSLNPKILEAAYLRILCEGAVQDNCWREALPMAELVRNREVLQTTEERRLKKLHLADYHLAIYRRKVRRLEAKLNDARRDVAEYEKEVLKWS